MCCSVSLCVDLSVLTFQQRQEYVLYTWRADWAQVKKSQEKINIFKIKQETSQTFELLCHNLCLLFSSNPSLSLIYSITHEPLTSHRVVLSINVCPIMTCFPHR